MIDSDQYPSVIYNHVNYNQFLAEELCLKSALEKKEIFKQADSHLINK